MARGDFPSAKQDQYMLRFPDGMRDQLKEEARKSGRSLNAEIIHRLANSLGNPRFEDFALGLGEDLDFDLMTAASYSGRSLHEEMVYRLKQSLAPESTLISELENRAWDARRKYDEILKLFIQLTPEERRLLEERAEIAEYARNKKVSSKKIGQFVKLNPIGNRGRFYLNLPATDYSAILSDDKIEDAAEIHADDEGKDD
jgi:hypothetical protein